MFSLSDKHCLIVIFYILFIFLDWQMRSNHSISPVLWQGFLVAINNSFIITSNCYLSSLWHPIPLGTGRLGFLKRLLKKLEEKENTVFFSCASLCAWFLLTSKEAESTEISIQRDVLTSDHAFISSRRSWVIHWPGNTTAQMAANTTLHNASRAWCDGPGTQSHYCFPCRGKDLSSIFSLKSWTSTKQSLSTMLKTVHAGRRVRG